MCCWMLYGGANFYMHTQCAVSMNDGKIVISLMKTKYVQKLSVRYGHVIRWHWHL